MREKGGGYESPWSLIRGFTSTTSRLVNEPRYRPCRPPMYRIRPPLWYALHFVRHPLGFSFLFDTWCHQSVIFSYQLFQVIKTNFPPSWHALRRSRRLPVAADIRCPPPSCCSSSATSPSPSPPLLLAPTGVRRPRPHPCACAVVALLPLLLLCGRRCALPTAVRGGTVNNNL